MESFRIFNDVTDTEPLYRVAGQKVSKPIAWCFVLYALGLFIGSVLGAQVGMWIPLILIALVGGIAMTLLFILDARLRGFGLHRVMVQIRLLTEAAHTPISRNY